MIKLSKLKTKCQTSVLMHNEYEYWLSCFSFAIKLTRINLDCMHNLCNLCIKHILLFERYLHLDKIIKFSMKTITCNKYHIVLQEIMLKFTVIQFWKNDFFFIKMKKHLCRRLLLYLVHYRQLNLLHHDQTKFETRALSVTEVKIWLVSRDVGILFQSRNTWYLKGFTSLFSNS